MSNESNPQPALPSAAPDPDCLGFIVRRAARAITKRYDQALSPFELNLSQYNLLTVMAKAGLRSLSEIGALSTTDRTTLNRSLGLLEAQGLVESNKGRDKRTRRFVLTQVGRERLKSAQQAWRAVQLDLYEQLGKGRFDRVHKDLEVLLAHLED